MNIQLLFAALLLAGSVAAAADPADEAAAQVEAGRRLYLEGVLPSGAPVRAQREGGAFVSGREAACVLCHRRTGLGAYEGTVIVPPVIGQALFGKFRRPGDRSPRRTRGMKFVDFDFRTRPPYDDKSLGLALRTGVSTSGHRFSYLMPRYDLDDEALRAITAYLRTLTTAPSPGVEPPRMHFASVIAPGSDASRRQLYLDTLRTCFAERNPVLRGRGGEKGEKGEKGEAAEHRWQLHIWELEGDPATWKAQLDARYAAQPVFAMLSGLGGERWEPVHDFCAARRIPCLFPNVDVVGGAEDTYNFYLSGGVDLDARVLARYLLDEAGRLGIRRVVQVAGPGRAEAVSATTLRDALAQSSIVLQDRPVPEPASDAGKRREHGFEDLGVGDALVLWLREPALRALAARVQTLPVHSSVFVSGRLLDPEHVPVPDAWRDASRMVFPYEAPGRWALRADFNLKPWLGKHGLPATDERLQGSVVTACALLSEGLGRTQGLLMRDYLVENIENIGNDSNAPATSPYPRFTLGPTQRAGSKGGYVVRLGAAESGELLRDSDWIVP
jgi:hypothetical protein